jgi:hypothetical protein
MNKVEVIVVDRCTGIIRQDAVEDLQKIAAMEGPQERSPVVIGGEIRSGLDVGLHRIGSFEEYAPSER